jgi:hypothetical protein
MLLEEKLPLFKAGIRRLAAFQKAASRVRWWDVADPRSTAEWEEYEPTGKEIRSERVQRIARVKSVAESRLDEPTASFSATQMP